MGHRALTPEVVKRAGELAALGLPMLSIAKGCGVGETTFYGWLRRAKEGTGSDLEVKLLQTIQEAHTKGEARLVQRLQQMADDGDAKAATWMLSHGASRDSWSDAAAVRRAETAILQRVADGIQSSRLTLAQQQEVLLSLRRQGLPAVEEP